jgi:hypothetical protein
MFDRPRQSQAMKFRWSPKRDIIFYPNGTIVKWDPATRIERRRYNTEDEIWVKENRVVKVKTHDNLYWEEGYGYEPANWIKRMWHRYGTTDIIGFFLLFVLMMFLFVQNYIWRIL